MHEYIQRRRDGILDRATTRVTTDFPFIPIDRLRPHLEVILARLVDALARGVRSPEGGKASVADAGARMGSEQAAASLPVSLLPREIGALSDALGSVSEADGVHFDPQLRDEVVARVDHLNLPSYTGFVMPKLEPVTDASGEIIDVKISYPCDLTTQMLEYSESLPVPGTNHDKAQTE